MTTSDPINGPGVTPTGTVARAMRLLTRMADAGAPVTIKYISDQTGLAPSTAHRLLGLLKDEGFVVDVLHSRSYAIGPQFYRVSARVVNSSSQMDFIARVLEELCDRYNETVLFGQYLPSEGSMSFAIRRDGNQKLLYQIEMHKPLSLVWGASGRAILAHLPANKVADILSREKSAPGNGDPVPPLDKLMADLREIKNAEYCVTYGQKLPGSRGIGTPLFDQSGIIGSLCLTAPENRQKDTDVDAIGRDLAANARKISHALGAKA